MGHGTSSGRTIRRSEADIAKATENANSVISTLKSGKSKQSITFESPENGHTIRADISYVSNRDYWGHAIGSKYYSVTVHDTTSGERLWYGYNYKTIKEARERIKRASGILR